MAKEKIIEIKTGPAIKNIQDLKNNIAAYKKELAGLDIGTNEYQRTLKSLQENQSALRNAMHGTTASFTEVMNAATAANVTFDNNNKLVKAETVSYNALVRELDILKQQWRATTNAAERADLSERITAVNDRLKDMDKSVGVFGRNVGNYIGAVDHLTAGLSSMGKGAAGMVGPLRGVTAGFKTLSATPAIAVLGLLANILQKVIDGLSSSEENTAGLTKAMAPFKAIGDAVTKTLQAMGTALVAVVGWFGKLTEAIFGANEASKERLRLAEEEDALNRKQRETLIQNAEAERDIAELRAKSSEKEKYTASERLAFLQEAGRLEAEISERAMADAKKQYEIIKAKNALTQSSKEEKEAEAKAYADMINAETAYFRKMREINAGIVEARRQEVKDAKDAAKAVKDAATAKINAEKDYLTQLLSITREGSESQFKLQNTIALKEKEKAEADARQKILDQEELNRALELIEKSYQVKIAKNRQEYDKKVLEDQVQAIKNRAEAAQKGSVEYAQAMLEAAQAERDGMRRQMDETDAQFKARRLASQRAAIEAQQALNDALLRETTDGLTAQMEALAEGTVERAALALQIEQEKMDNLYQGVDESLDAFTARSLEQAKAVGEAMDALLDAELNQDTAILQQRMASLQEGSTAYLETALELKAAELDALHQLEGESNDAFRLREIEKEKEVADAQKALFQSRVSMFQNYASAVSGLLSGIADLYENDAESSREAAEKAKNLRIASATIEMISGAVGAYSQAVATIPPPTGPIIGGINATAVTASGLANIAKIRATPISTSSSSSASGAVVAPPAVTPEVQEVRTITGASEEDRLNQMAKPIRAYIVDSELQAKQEQNRREQQETTF